MKNTRLNEVASPINTKATCYNSYLNLSVDIYL